MKAFVVCLVYLSTWEKLLEISSFFLFLLLLLEGKETNFLFSLFAFDNSDHERRPATSKLLSCRYQRLQSLLNAVDVQR